MAASSFTNFANPRGLSKQSLKNNPTWVAMSRVFAHSEAHARELVDQALELAERLTDEQFPIRELVFAVWKGNRVSEIPGDTGHLGPLLTAAKRKLELPFEVRVSDVECRDPYGTLLNLGAGYAAQRGGDYLLPVSLQALDYLSEEVALGFIEAAQAGAWGVGVKMSEVAQLVGPSNRLALWAVGPLLGTRGFATSIDVLPGMSFAQEQTPTIMNMLRHRGKACISMIDSPRQGGYRLPSSKEGRQVHDRVEATIKEQQAAWLSSMNASADELAATIMH